jgi:hypothetical protein
VVVSVKVAAKIKRFAYAYGLPRKGAVNIDVGGKFEVSVVVRSTGIHKFGKARQLPGVLNEIGIAFRSASLRPKLRSAIPNGGVVLGISPLRNKPDQTEHYNAQKVKSFHNLVLLCL